MIIFKRNIIIYILIVLLAFNIPISANAIDIMFYTMTVADGLSQSTIKTIFQDSNGYMWLGTNDGLNKYNGFEFEIYNKALLDSNKIVSGNIYCINEDLDKQLWVGTGDGLSTISLENNKITNYTTNNSSLPSNKINDIKIDSNGNIILATTKGLAIYNKEKKDFDSLLDKNTNYTFNDIISIEIYNNEVYAITSNSFFKYNLITNEYSIFDNENIYYLSQENAFTDISIYEDKIYLGTTSYGIYTLNINTNKIENEYKLPKSDDNSKSLIVNHIYNDGNNLWIGTDNGVYIYQKDGTIDIFTRSSSNKYSLSNDNVLYITQDSIGLTWIGTYSGLSRVDYNTGVGYFNNFPNNSGINGNIALGGYEDSDATLYIGLYGNGLCILNKNTGETTYINTTTPNKLSNDNVWDVKGNEKYIFVATESGLNIIDRNTLDVKIISEELSSNSTNTLFIDGDKLWVGVKGGFDIVDLNDFTVTSINPLLKENNIHVGLGSSVYKDSTGIYWLGSASKDGLIRFNSNNDSVKLYEYSETDNCISDNTIISIAEDNDGNMWFGTESGLNKYNRETDEFISYFMKDGLSNNTIYSIVPHENHIVISTNRGINCITFDNDNITSIKKYFTDTEFNSNSFVKLISGNITFGATDGLYFLYPNAFKDRTYIPEVKFDSFYVNGLNVDTLENASIEYGNNSISIKLFSTVYSSIDNVKFYYRIDNSNEEWTLINKNEVTFSNLASGKYNFEFKTVNSEGTSSSIETISFKVKPPFWQGNFAKSLYLLMFITIIVYLSLKIKYMNISIKARTNQLNREVTAKNELLLKNIELEKRKNNYLINMSHELRTPLNVIYSIHQLISDFNKKAPLAQKELAKYMDMSHNNIKRLLKIINDLIDSTKIDEGNYKLFIEEKDIVYVVEEAALSLKNLVEEKDINLIIDTNIEECIMKFDSNAIERCIVNIVGNACKFTEPGGDITVNIIDLYSIIRIDISDTGSGIPKENINTIFDRFNQVVNSTRELSDGNGLGLTITKRLVELHNGHIFVKSGLGKGSTFTIVLPKNN